MGIVVATDARRLVLFENDEDEGAFMEHVR